LNEPEQKVDAEHVTADDRKEVEPVIVVTLDQNAIRAHVNDASQVSCLTAVLSWRQVTHSELESILVSREDQEVSLFDTHLSHCVRELDFVLWVDFEGLDKSLGHKHFAAPCL